MKVNLILSLVLAALISAGPVPALAYDIDDSENGANTYWGGLVGNSQPSSVDVIGTHFDIAGMNVMITGKTMTVQIIGDYFHYAGGPGNDGDLYLSSSGWKVSGSSHHSTDTFKTDGSEGWDYVVGVKKVSDYSTGRRVIVDVPGVYKLIFANTDPPFDNAFQFTTGGPSSGGRALQAYRGGYGDFVEPATITPDYAHSMLAYTFDTSFLTNPGSVGFHWAMYCGNDVIEGQSHGVPEPGTLLLLCFGLAGLTCKKRSKREPLRFFRLRLIEGRNLPVPDGYC